MQRSGSGDPAGIDSIVVLFRRGDGAPHQGKCDLQCRCVRNQMIVDPASEDGLLPSLRSPSTLFVTWLIAFIRPLTVAQPWRSHPAALPKWASWSSLGTPQKRFAATRSQRLRA
jgi:hypothetical protein